MKKATNFLATLGLLAFVEVNANLSLIAIMKFKRLWFEEIQFSSYTQFD
jgi:hypothetical protein